MTFILGSSREVHPNPRTPAHVRAVLASLFRDQEDDDIRIVDILATIATLLASFTRTAEAAEAMTAGQIVRLTGDETIALARAHQSPDWDVVGAVTEDVAIGNLVDYIPVGIVHREGWSLTRGSLYFLSASSGGEVVSAPDVVTDNNRIVPVGRAFTSEDLYIFPFTPILL